MENWLLYVFIGLLVGLLVIFIYEELERTESVANGMNQLSNAQNQRQLILKELNNRLSHKDNIKEQAIISCYEFATSMNQFTLKDLEKETSSLQQHYKKHIKNDTTYRINFPEKSILNFQPLAMFRLLTVINESLHNAAMYSQANFIFSIASIEHGKLNIITHDNGVGYNRKVTPDGTGINNILKSVQELNGDLKLTSTAGNGTVVNLEIPIEQF